MSGVEQTSLGCMQDGRDEGRAVESSGLPFPERAAHTPFRRRMVHGTGKCSEGIERTGLLGMKSDMQG